MGQQFKLKSLILHLILKQKILELNIKSKITKSRIRLLHYYKLFLRLSKSKVNYLTILNKFFRVLSVCCILRETQISLISFKICTLKRTLNLLISFFKKNHIMAYIYFQIDYNKQINQYSSKVMNSNWARLNLALSIARIIKKLFKTN